MTVPCGAPSDAKVRASAFVLSTASNATNRQPVGSRGSGALSVAPVNGTSSQRNSVAAARDAASRMGAGNAKNSNVKTLVTVSIPVIIGSTG